MFGCFLLQLAITPTTGDFFIWHFNNAPSFPYLSDWHFHIFPAFWREAPDLAFCVSLVVQIFYNKILAASWSVQLHLIIETCLSGLGDCPDSESSSVKSLLEQHQGYLSMILGAGNHQYGISHLGWNMLIFYEIFCSKMQQSSAAQPHPGKALGLQ